MGCEIWDRFTIHLTPKHESWLNQAEIEIGFFSRQCLGKRRIPDLPLLRRESRAWNGNSIAEPLDESSATNAKPSRGQRPRLGQPPMAPNDPRLLAISIRNLQVRSNTDVACSLE
jgi:hypothetical protein